MSTETVFEKRAQAVSESSRNTIEKAIAMAKEEHWSPTDNPHAVRAVTSDRRVLMEEADQLFQYMKWDIQKLTSEIRLVSVQGPDCYFMANTQF